jgi:uncharacterized membrane protein
MVEKPKSTHLEKETTGIFRNLVMFASVMCLLLLFSVTYLASKLLEGSFFGMAGMVLLLLVLVGVILFLFLLLYRKKYKREREHLEKYTFNFKEFMPHKKHKLKSK